MKFTKLLLLLAVFAFFSCSDDDEEDVAPVGSIAGTWTLTGMTYEATSTTTVPGFDTISTTTNGNGFDMNLEITFNDDPKTFTSSGDYKVATEYEIQGQSFTQEFTFTGFANEGTWRQEGDKIIIVSSTGGEEEATIETVNANTLVLRSQENYVENYTGGFSVANDIDGVLTFSRK